MTEEEIRLTMEELKGVDEESSSFSWIGVIEKLAGGDITKFESVTETDFILCLNWLSYLTYKEKRMTKQQEEELKEHKKKQQQQFNH